MRVIQTKGTNKAHVTRRRNSTQPTDSWLLNYVYDKWQQEQPEVIRVTLKNVRV